MFSLHEVIDIVIMSLVIGYIFKDLFPRRPKVEVIMPDDLLKSSKRYNWSDFWFAVAVVAPSIILHEFGHKFFAIANGMAASFHSPLSIQHLFNPLLVFQDFAAMLTVIVIVLKYLGIGFFFFIPAYVTIAGGGTALQMAAVAFAGPAVNLVLWLSTMIFLKKHKKLKGDKFHFIFIMSRINMFLFIFNMLPIPGFDGFSVYMYLIKAFF